ncbi:MAG TPA: family 16 glycoside hydrolase [Puia sp.]|nr:family 16 glycoside hydrolase [Puia sp.]
MQKHLSLLCLCLLIASLFAKLPAQNIPLKDWTPLSEDNKNTPPIDTVFQGKPCVKLDGHAVAAIWNKKASLKNFRLELDIAGSVMSGVGFHVSDEQNYQFLYFRPGYGGTIEAIQYIPIYNGALSWVFYGAYQASADIHKGQWFHAAIEVRGDNLKVFTNGNTRPDMEIRMLRSEADRGSVLLRTMFGEAYFANLTWRDLPETITAWEISEQLPVPRTYGYEQVKTVKQWRAVNEPGDDYVNLSRYFKTLEGTVIARHIIHADSAGNKLLSFDFTGTLHVFLNGKEIYTYDKYKLDRVEADTYRIRLPLQKGDNELVFITQGDGFIFGKGYNSLGRIQHQNWGFIAAINN